MRQEEICKPQTNVRVYSHTREGSGDDEEKTQQSHRAAAFPLYIHGIALGQRMNGRETEMRGGVVSNGEI